MGEDVTFPPPFKHDDIDEYMRELQSAKESGERAATMQTSFNRMNLRAIPHMVGKDARERFDEISSVLNHTQWPVYLVGPSGSGKTLMAMNLAKKYALEHKVPAYYVQLSPDQTKTSVILGLRLVKGSLIAVKGVVAQAMEEGAIVIVDEATHTTQELLLMFNSVLDRTSITSIGDEVVYADEKFRTIFCSNSSSYAGNVRLPQSFAQRVVTFHFDYPSLDDEIKICQKIAEEEYNGSYDVPESAAKYVATFMREQRTETFPLSARNMAIALIRMTIARKSDSTDIDRYFTQDANVESTRRQIVKRITGKDASNTVQLTDPDIMAFVTYVSQLGVGKFREIILSATMFHLDVDGTELSRDVIRQKILSSII